MAPADGSDPGSSSVPLHLRFWKLSLCVCISCNFSLPLQRISVREQDSLYRAKYVRASNCLLDAPREYSLLHSNCQHFILELIRRIELEGLPGTRTDIENASQRPRFRCHLLLCCAGFLVNLPVALLPPGPATYLWCPILWSFHVMYSMVLIQDYTRRVLRLDLLYNEQRYLYIGDEQRRRGPRNYSTQGRRKLNRMSTQGKLGRSYYTWLTLSSLCMALPLSFGIYKTFVWPGPWAIGFILLAGLTCYIGICIPANGILSVLKSNNRITALRKQEKEDRLQVACKELQKEWDTYGGSCLCPVDRFRPYHHDDNFCRRYFLDYASQEIEASWVSCVRGDLEDAAAIWRATNRLPSETKDSVRKTLMLALYGCFGLTLVLLWEFHVFCSDFLGIQRLRLLILGYLTVFDR
jgi:hypothetical protein